MGKNDFSELNNINGATKACSKPCESDCDIIEEETESDPAFCDEENESPLKGQLLFDDDLTSNNKGTIFDNGVYGVDENSLDYCDSVVIDEDLLEALKNEGTIFDIERIKNKTSVTNSFILSNVLKDKAIYQANSPFIEPIDKQQENEKKKQLQEFLRIKGKEILKEESEKETIKTSQVGDSKGTDDSEQASKDLQELNVQNAINVQSNEQVIASIALEKQAKKQALQQISNKIMAEKEITQVVDENKQIELGEKVKRIESPFSDVQRRSQYRASGYALANSPFLAPNKVENVAISRQEPFIFPERVVEKQTPIVIQNIQKSNNDELNDKICKLSERIDELSKVVVPFENMNQMVKESIKESLLDNKKEEQTKPIEKPKTQDNSEVIICEVCGHINKKGSSVCEQCSNIFENA